MKEFDFRKYLKQNPLLKESVNEKFSNWQPGFEDFWDRVYDGAIEKAIEISKESGDGMNIEEISRAIENECANPNRVMQALEADGEVDDAINYVLDSLELGEPVGPSDTEVAFTRSRANRTGYNPMNEEDDDRPYVPPQNAHEPWEMWWSSLSDDQQKEVMRQSKEYDDRHKSDEINEADSMVFDKGWQYDDEDDDEEIYHDDSFVGSDERERFLGLGGQEILDGIKFLIDDGFELEDIIKQIKQHSNYLQGPTINERKKVATGEISVPIMDAMDIIDSNGKPLDPDKLSSSGPNGKRVSSYVNKLLYSTVEYDGQTYEIESIDDDSDIPHYSQQYAQGEPSIHLVKVDY